MSCNMLAAHIIVLLAALLVEDKAFNSCFFRQQLFLDGVPQLKILLFITQAALYQGYRVLEDYFQCLNDQIYTRQAYYMSTTNQHKILLDLFVISISVHVANISESQMLKVLSSAPFNMFFGLTTRFLFASSSHGLDKSLVHN